MMVMIMIMITCMHNSREPSISYHCLTYFHKIQKGGASFLSYMWVNWGLACEETRPRLERWIRFQFCFMHNCYTFNHCTLLDIIKKLSMCLVKLKWLNSLLFMLMAQGDSWLKMNEILEICMGMVMESDRIMK